MEGEREREKKYMGKGRGGARREGEMRSCRRGKNRNGVTLGSKMMMTAGFDESFSATHKN